MLRRKEELIFAVIVFGPNVQGLCEPATQLRIYLLDIGRDYTVMADRQIDALLLIGEPNHSQVSNDHASEVTVVALRVFDMIHAVDHLLILDQS